MRDLLKGRAVSDIFSWRSPSFKALGRDAGSINDDELIQLMLQEPRLIRRPMVRIGDELVVGADLKSLESVLGRS